MIKEYISETFDKYIKTPIHITVFLGSAVVIGTVWTAKSAWKAIRK